MTETVTTPPPSDATGPAHRYNADLAAVIERRWQERWEREGTFEAPNPAGPMAEPDKVAGRPKLYVLDMFPYPSGSGLHVGHPLGYIATDVFGRFKRMTGYNVLHALGYDAFGLPGRAVRGADGPPTRGSRPRPTSPTCGARCASPRARPRPAPRPVATTDVDYYKLDAVDLPADLQQLVRRDGCRRRPSDRGARSAEFASGDASGARPVSQWSASSQPVDHDARWSTDVPPRLHRGGSGQLVPRARAPSSPTKRSPPTAAVRSGQPPRVHKSQPLKQWMMRITAYN